MSARASLKMLALVLSRSPYVRLRHVMKALVTPTARAQADEKLRSRLHSWTEVN